MGPSLQSVFDDLQRQEIDVSITHLFDRKRGSDAIATQIFRLDGICSDDNGGYHLYLTDLDRDDYNASDIEHLYRERWEIELLFKGLQSRFRLEDINSTEPLHH